MSSVRSRFSRRKSAIGRPHFWFYLFVSLAFLSLEAIGVSVPGQVRGLATDLVSPILNVAEMPIRSVRTGIERIAGVSDIYLENEALRAENQRLFRWREAALRLTAQNEQLRRIVKAPGQEVSTLATGRVVGVGGGTFERSILINVGSQHGVRQNLPVVDEQGVVGRTLHVGAISSRVLLITDLNSRIPVRLEKSGHLGILEGRNEAQLNLIYLPDDANVEEGDRVVTSGHGGVFPPDLPIGRVVLVAPGRILVSPRGLMDRLDYMKVLDYQAPPADVEKIEVDDSPRLPARNVDALPGGEVDSDTDEVDASRPATETTEEEGD